MKWLFMLSGTLRHDMHFEIPYAALFFNHSPSILIVACENDIFIVDARTQSTRQFSKTPKDTIYYPHGLALSDDDTVLVAGCDYPYSVCAYDTATLERLWIFNTACEVGAVCMLGAHVVATVYMNPTLVLDLNTGVRIAALQKAEGWIFGLGVIEGICLILLVHVISHRPQHLRVPCHAAAPPLQAS